MIYQKRPACFYHKPVVFYLTGFGRQKALHKMGYGRLHKMFLKLPCSYP